MLISDFAGQMICSWLLFPLGCQQSSYGVPSRQCLPVQGVCERNGMEEEGNLRSAEGKSWVGWVYTKQCSPRGVEVVGESGLL